MISRAGWQHFAGKFPVEYKPDGKTFRSRSGHFNSRATYSGALNITLSRDGIYAAVMFLFRFGHQPFLVPWSHVSNIRDKKLLFLK